MGDDEGNETVGVFRHDYFKKTHSFSQTQRLTMSSPLSSIPGVGEVTLEAFNRANYSTIRDLFGFDSGNVAGDRKLMEAIQDMKNEAKPPLPDRFYRSLGTRCANIVNRVRNARALPYAPDHLLCRISLDLMQNPVVTPSGYTYDRVNIEQWVEEHASDPMTRQPLTSDQLYPNRAIHEAIMYYKNNYQSFIIPKFE